MLLLWYFVMNFTHKPFGPHAQLTWCWATAPYWLLYSLLQSCSPNICVLWFYITRAVFITPTAVLFRQILHLHTSLSDSRMIHCHWTYWHSCRENTSVLCWFFSPYESEAGLLRSCCSTLLADSSKWLSLYFYQYDFCIIRAIFI